MLMQGLSLRLHTVLGAERVCPHPKLGGLGTRAQA